MLSQERRWALFLNTHTHQLQLLVAGGGREQMFALGVYWHCFSLQPFNSYKKSKRESSYSWGINK